MPHALLLLSKHAHSPGIAQTTRTHTSCRCKLSFVSERPHTQQPAWHSTSGVVTAIDRLLTGPAPQAPGRGWGSPGRPRNSSSSRRLAHTGCSAGVSMSQTCSRTLPASCTRTSTAAPCLKSRNASLESQTCTHHSNCHAAKHLRFTVPTGKLF
jgi:hypothetical protein